ncbi:glycosyltransferase [Iningainema tapete]|uniref:Glycosyltransferase n=1 Tax=Iningainema tapete BLCC-T55 TaxID=2748662 RepID=A0A8J6XFZ9_9CYAN|nr:glycosyltransferase [Iningainema tapete]MBD2776045.1 glycosyltransferase [Iningainema tapete BLCC-T55]
MSKSPDIAIFLRELYGGGAERTILNLAGAFLKQDLNVDLVVARAKGSFLERVPPEIRLVDLKSQWVLNSLPKLVEYLRRDRPTTLLAALHYPCEIALWAKRLSGVSTRVVVCEQNTLSVEAQRIPQISVRLTPLAARLFYPWADGIVAVSHGVAQDLANITYLPQKRIQVIHNPVVVPEIFTRAQESVDHPWFQPGEPPVILAVGRLYLQKDFPTLIRAFAQVRQLLPARLVILGDGPEKPQLETLIRELGLDEEVALLGFVQNPYAYMAQAKVFVLSSAWEGLPTVLIEAMAVGTPVVSTNCPSGPSEILAEGKYGLLTPVGDSKAMAQAILSVLSGNAKRVDPSWLHQFSLEACAEKYLNVLGFNYLNSDNCSQLDTVKLS